MEQTNASHNLEGRILGRGWNVIEKISKSDNATGSFFSVCYKVTKENETCFLKAFDFARFFQIAGHSSVVDVMSGMLDAYRYEKNLSDLCKNHHVTKVSFVKDAGEEIVDGYTISIVPYLVFDLADGDVRQKLNFSEGLDFAWRLKSLHDIAVGLKQLHSIEVSHQDLKPSNILLFNGESKLGDLGRSVCRRIQSPYDELVFSGDLNYAPPEIMYQYYESDWYKRVFATDCYLLGSMAVFYFAGVSMSALLLSHMPYEFRWDIWRGTFEDVRPYLINAFAKALDEFEQSIANEYFKKELRSTIEMLCFPFPENRGHPKNIRGIGNSYNLERFISKFDVLHKKAMYKFINDKRI